MKKKHVAVLEEIGASIPKEYTDNLMMKVDSWANMKNVLQKAVDSPDYPEEKKENLRLILKTGYLDTKEDIADPVVEAKIDKYLEEEIERAKRLGKLPKQFKPNGKNKRKSKRNSTKSDEEERSE